MVKKRGKTNSTDMLLTKNPYGTSNPYAGAGGKGGKNAPSSAENAHMAGSTSAARQQQPAGGKAVGQSSDGSPFSELSADSSHHWEEVKDFEPIDSPYIEHSDTFSQNEKGEMHGGEKMATDMDGSAMTPHSTPSRHAATSNPRQQRHDDDEDDVGFRSTLADSNTHKKDSEHGTKDSSKSMNSAAATPVKRTDDSRANLAQSISPTSAATKSNRPHDNSAAPSKAPKQQPSSYRPEQQDTKEKRQRVLHVQEIFDICEDNVEFTMTSFGTAEEESDVSEHDATPQHMIEPKKMPKKEGLAKLINEIRMERELKQKALKAVHETIKREFGNDEEEIFEINPKRKSSRRRLSSTRKTEKLVDEILNELVEAYKAQLLRSEKQRKFRMLGPNEHLMSTVQLNEHLLNVLISVLEL